MSIFFVGCFFLWGVVFHMEHYACGLCWVHFLLWVCGLFLSSLQGLRHSFLNYC